MENFRELFVTYRIDRDVGRLMAARFVSLGLCATATSLQDAISFATNFIANKAAFSEALTKSFDIWRVELGLRQPSKDEWAKFVNDCDAKIRAVTIRMADFVGEKNYAFTDESVNTIWMNPLLVAAQEEVKLQVLTDLIRVKFLHGIWHLLTSRFIAFALRLGYQGHLLSGDNGYAFEEVTLGGRLFIRQGTKLFTEANALDLEMWVGQNLILTHLAPVWNTNNKDTGPLSAFLAPVTIAAIPASGAKRAAEKRKHTSKGKASKGKAIKGKAIKGHQDDGDIDQDSDEQELFSTAQPVKPRKLWPGHPDADTTPLPPGCKA